jgi:Gas vesicle synthesis protein GvpL/GvpF
MKRRATRAAEKPGARDRPPATGGNVYLYGIIRWPVPGGLSVLRTAAGVGDPPGEVRAVRSGDLAALVSDVSAAEMSAQGVRGMRRDMKAHSSVLNALAAKITVLPARFGVVLPDERALIAEFLDPRRGALEEYLDRLDGTVEVTLRASYIEEQVLRELVSAQPELAGGRVARRGRSASMATESRIELGRQIAAAIQDLKDRDARFLLEVLTPVAHDVRIGKPLTDLMVLNASFLVERAMLTKFDRTLEIATPEVGHRMTFDCVGPLPPFSFVDLRL